MSRAFGAALAAPALAAMLLAGCGGNVQGRVPQPFGTRDATALLRDAVVIAAVKATLTGADPDSAATVGVSARDGVVTLRGRVNSAATRARLETAARNTSGVKRVVDLLRVDPRSPLLRLQAGDAALAARVETAITAQVGLQHVGVRVDRGVATLDGTVPDRRTKATVLSTARGTSGIRNVVDRVRVAGP